MVGFGLLRLDNIKGESDSRLVFRMSGVVLLSVSGNVNVKIVIFVRL